MGWVQRRMGREKLKTVSTDTLSFTGRERKKQGKSWEYSGAASFVLCLGFKKITLAWG